MPKPLSLDPRVRKLLKKGIVHHQAGRWGQAETHYRRTLQADPRCPQALHMLGLLAQQAGEDAKAIPLLEEALGLNPDDADILTTLAVSCAGQGDSERALGYYRRVAALCPQSAPAHTNLGQAEEQFGDLSAAATAYRRALELGPDSAEGNCQLANVLRGKGELSQALSLLEHALALDPDRFQTYNDLGTVYTDSKNPAAAVEAFRRSHALKPDSALTALSLGYFFAMRGDLPGAADSLRCAIKLDAELHLAHLSLGSVLSEMGDAAGALECYQRARVLAPASANVVFCLGILHLSQGNFALGWEEYEQREGARRSRRTYSLPQWKGEPLQGARIFLHPEQGLGDTLLALRYVPWVAARGGEVVLAVQARLHRLLAGTEGARQVISDGETAAHIQWQCPLLSLPRAFATEVNTIPAVIPYVCPDPVLVKFWERRLAGNSLRVGLVWGGDPRHPHDHRRSIPLEQLALLTRIEGTTFYSLQMGPPAGQVKQLGPRARLIDLQDEQNDFADTAAIIANLDLVISVDTSVVHLAGAMGKPVWVLLNNSPDWRWMLGREDSPWYPTARLFRQSNQRNWREVVTRVEGELRELVARTPIAAGNGA